MRTIDREELKRYAKRYIWWQSPDVAVRFPQRVVARVMNIGDFDDVVALAKQAGDDYLRDVLTHAEIGQFTPRSWHYWHYRLGLASAPDEVPPMPSRRLGSMSQGTDIEGSQSHDNWLEPK
jgi:hypothetical protein